MRKTFLFFVVLLFIIQATCAKKPEFSDGSVIVTNKDSKGKHISLEFTRGNAWGQKVSFGPVKMSIKPQIAVWVGDTAGNIKQNLYVTRCFAKQEWRGIKNHPDSTYRTSSLPFWMNRLIKASLQIPTKAHPLADAVTSATPQGSFTIESTLDSSVNEGSIWCEFNSSFDNNETWPADKNNKESFNGQPSLLFRGDFTQGGAMGPVVMKYMGRGGEKGTDGNLYANDTGITTAKEIITKIVFSIK